MWGNGVRSPQEGSAEVESEGREESRKKKTSPRLKAIEALTAMAQHHEQIAQAIERRRQQEQTKRPPDSRRKKSPA